MKFKQKSFYTLNDILTNFISSRRSLGTKRWENPIEAAAKERRKNCVNRPSAFGETSRSRALDYVSNHPLLAFIRQKDEVFIKHLTIV